MKIASLAILSVLISGVAAAASPEQVGEMISIPAGEFRMGDSVGDGSRDEKPVHTVHIKAFRLAAHEVTFEQYDAFARAAADALAANNDHFAGALPDDNGWGRGNRPVFNVSWDEAQQYIAWLNKQTGQHFRLPTEAEWEYAARAGTTTNYPWGDKFSPAQANGANALMKTTPTGQYPANRFGLYDMIGNVYEWVEDCYHDSYAGAPTDGSAWIAGGDCAARRVSRGGSWGSDATNLRVSNHFAVNISSRNGNLGFRLAQDQ